MNISVLTPDRSIYQGSIISVKVPGTLGEFQILKNHAPIVSSLEAGKVTLKLEDGSEKVFTIEKGFVEVLKNEISLLVQGVQE